MSKTLRIATRKSPLALWQANEVGRLLTEFHPDLNVELVTMKTKGDKILDTPLAKVGGKGLFVKELETGMLEGKADIAVHSMKDVPISFPDGLYLPVILERENPRDAFVSNSFASLDDLPADAKIGTCSLRRQTQLREKMPNIEILDLRGSVNTRLQKLDDGNFDAIILASSGLIRLGYESRIAQDIPTTRSLPAVGQGAIGIECREDDDYINELIAPLNHHDTFLRVRAERAMNTRLNGGCQVPIAGFAELHDDNLTLRGLVGYPDGSALFRSEKTGLATDGEAIGIAVAEDILAQGGDKALEAVGIDT